MVCVLMPKCNFLYGYFQCQLPEDIINVEVTGRAMKRIHMFKRNHAMQIIPCRSRSSQHHPYLSLAGKMRTYLELKDHIADPLHSNSTYPDRPNTLPPQKSQASRKRMGIENPRREARLPK